jgi:NodT family efflux transporter outer membrane factor (OMF) lipoprotein
MKLCFRLSLVGLLTASACTPLSSDLSSNTEIASATKPFSDVQAWWKIYRDPLLNELAEKLCSQNIDLKIAALRVLEAKALAASSDADLLPEVTLQARTNRGDRQSRRPATLSEAGIAATWDVDIFGADRAARSALHAEAIARSADVSDVRNMLISEVVRSVLQWRESQSSQRELDKIISIQEQQRGLLAARAQAGLTDDGVVEQAEAILAQIKGEATSLEARQRSAQYRIERILALPPQSLTDLFMRYTDPHLEVPDVAVLTSLSIDELRNRPDLRSARARISAAEARVRQAEADLWPKISITSFFGVVKASDALNFIISDNPIWAAGGALTQPILNFEKLRSIVLARDAQLQQALTSYERLVHLALQETSTALSDYVQGVNKVRQSDQEIGARQRAVELAEERYKRGLVDMTYLLRIQLELGQTKLRSTAYKGNTAEAYVRLQEALAQALLETS